MLKRIDEECVLGLFNASLNLEHAPSNKVRRASSELNGAIRSLETHYRGDEWQQ
jgi:hypothetical protein